MGAPRTQLVEDQPSSVGPQIACDLPLERDGAVVHNDLVLSGWATAAAGVSGVVVEIDGRVLHASYGLDTPWLTESMPGVAGADRAGYRLELDTSTWPPGRRQVTITAYDQAGERGAIGGSVDVIPFAPPKYTPADNRAAIEAGEIAMWLERPSAGPAAEVEQPVEISGWAYARGGVGSVLVTIDGQLRTPALGPICRPDLIDDYGEEVASQAGFVLRLDAHECAPGWHRLRVVATDGDGRAVGQEIDFRCLPEPPPVEAPAPGESMPIAWRPDPQPPPPRLRSPDEDDAVGGEPFLDAERELRREVAARLAADGDVLEVDRPDLPALPHEDASFDLVVCFEAIDDADDPAAALDELRRVLRPEGVLLIAASRHSAAAGQRLPGGLERALRDRFANVLVGRQRTLLASLIADDATLAREGALDVGAELHKLGCARPGGEDHVLAVAGDGELPELPPIALLAPPSAVRRLRDTVAQWRDRAQLAEADAAASRNQANLARMHQEATVRQWRAAQREVAALTAALGDAAAERDRQSAEHAKLAEQARQQAAAQLDAAERRAGDAAAAAAAAATAITSSFSWRITRPLRAVKRLVRRPPR